MAAEYKLIKDLDGNGPCLDYDGTKLVAMLTPAPYASGDLIETGSITNGVLTNGSGFVRFTITGTEYASAYDIYIFIKYDGKANMNFAVTANNITPGTLAEVRVLVVGEFWDASNIGTGSMYPATASFEQPYYRYRLRLILTGRSADGNTGWIQVDWATSD